MLTDWRLCSLWVSWTGQLPSMPGSSRPLCRPPTRPRWPAVRGAQSAAGVWPGSTATACRRCWGLWMWTSSPTAGTTTTSGSQRTWSVLAPSWGAKTPVRWGTKPTNRESSWFIFDWSNTNTARWCNNNNNNINLALKCCSHCFFSPPAT